MWGAAVVVQIAAGAGYHTAVMKWNVFIGNICDGCWQQL
jgi:protein-L-isoaspartate O-methyltransferase